MKVKPAYVVIQKVATKNVLAFFICVSLFFLQEGFAQSAKKVVAVKYISADKVYIGGEKSDGIAIGDELEIIRSGKTIP